MSAKITPRPRKRTGTRVSPKRNRRGYTVVELMMAMGVMTIGIMGVFSMQKVTLEANQHAKNLSIANHIAQAWLDELAAESSQWNGTNDFDETVWLGLVGGENTVNPNWVRPTHSVARSFGPAFDALGNPVATLNIANDAHFCSDIRLTWMHGQDTFKKGGGLIRAQVRVYWRTQGTLDLTGSAPAHVCAKTALEMDQPDALQLFHFVYATTAVRQHLGTE